MILGYLDPGSGSLILQAVLGGVAGVGVAFRAFRQRMKRRRQGESEVTDPAEEAADPGQEEDPSQLDG